MSETSFQIQVEIMRPPAFQMAKCKLPEDMIKSMNQHIDEHVGEDYSHSLAGRIDQQEKSRQTTFLFEGEVGSKVKETLNGLASKHLKASYRRNSKAEVSDAWTVHSYSGDYNPVHTHGVQTDAGLSCIAYLKVPESIENTETQDGFTSFYWGLHSLKDTALLKEPVSMYVKPEVGILLLFPCWLNHSVSPFYGAGERRTFAANFNIYDEDDTA